MKTLYLLLTIVGTIAPWFWLSQDLPTLLSPSLFLQATFANPIASAWASDLLISAIAFFCFVWFELKRLNCAQSWFWLYVALTFGVGVSCSLPFFLYRRAQILEQKSLR
jgi:Terpene cyclase DEP1